jgi:OFA family oxalate/formate antiporter-like MFS transporter
MSDTALESSPTQTNYGWRVALAGLGINLALGVLYSWSIFNKNIPTGWRWEETDKSIPYGVACLVFSLVMVPAGRMQDALGPRLVATIGGVFVGIGFLLAGVTQTVWGYTLGFGVLAGMGFAFGYASATPPAVKWFPPAKTGLIAGIVVSGFGLASVYIAPLSTWLIGEVGLATAIQILGVAFLLIVVALAQLLRPPSPGYVPPGTPATTSGGKSTAQRDLLPREMLATWQFYLLWVLYACGAGAGLMIIGVHAKIMTPAYVAVLAVGNGAGRIAAGFASDKIGRKATLLICFLLQAGALGLLTQIAPPPPAAPAAQGRANVTPSAPAPAPQNSLLSSVPVLVLLSLLIGANYGANLALFPSITKDFYGLKHFGTNYGLVFTAWGVGGFMLAQLAGRIYDATKSFNFAYFTSAGLLVAAAAATLLIASPRRT